MRLTIITPVFNGAKYIKQCLENVISQQCDVVEHLIMDGLSTDGTPELVLEYAKKHPHIRLISEKDNGQSDAMNKGIAEAKGEIISFLNVDDYYEPGVFNRVLETFKDLPEPSFVCGNLNIWNPNNTLKHFNRPDRISLVELVSNCFEWPYNPTAYFYHKSLHLKTGPYNVENHLCMDYEFILEAASHTKLIHVDELWGNFKLVEDSKTQKYHANEANKADEDGVKIRNRAKNKLSSNEIQQLDIILMNNLMSNISTEKTFLEKIKTNFKRLLRKV